MTVESFAIWVTLLMKIIIVVGFIFVMLKVFKQVDFNKLVMNKDDALPSTSRFQMLFWTAVYGCAFMYKFFTSDKMPEFTTAQMSLLGISGGVYLGAKVLGPSGPLRRSGGAQASDSEALAVASKQLADAIKTAASSKQE